MQGANEWPRRDFPLLKTRTIGPDKELSHNEKMFGRKDAQKY